MIECILEYEEHESGGYTARCGACGRVVRTKTRKAKATCRKNSVQQPPPGLAAEMALLSGTAAYTHGPGWHLKEILSGWLGITADSGCRCNDMAARMDAMGPDWCESDEGMAAIIDAMRSEHAKRRADGRTKLPWTDFGAKQLVRLACRRARADAEEQGRHADDAARPGSVN
jgi:hypothetical protein